MKRLVTVLALAIVIPACSAPTQDEFGPEDMNAIKQRTQEYAAAFNAKDVAKVMSFHPGSAVFMPPNTGTLRGTESIQGFYKTLIEGGVTDLTMDPKDIGGEGKLAYQSGTFRLVTRPPGGGPETRDRGKYLFVLRNFAGQWKIEYTIWSSDLPPATATGS